MGKKARKRIGDAELDMTPMIDVVFQLIIFFIVTIKLNEQINEDIILEDAPHGPIIKSDSDPRTIILEVAKNGRISIYNATMTERQLAGILIARMRRYHGTYPVLIRADWRTKHRDVKRVMDVCSGVGLWRINFAAVQDHKYTAGRHLGPPGR